MRLSDFHDPFQVAHTISIWLTLSLAFWRYEVLKNGRHQRRKNGRRCHQVNIFVRQLDILLNWHIEFLFDAEKFSFGLALTGTMHANHCFGLHRLRLALHPVFYYVRCGATVGDDQ